MFYRDYIQAEKLVTPRNYLKLKQTSLNIVMSRLTMVILTHEHVAKQFPPKQIIFFIHFFLLIHLDLTMPGNIIFYI